MLKFESNSNACPNKIEKHEKKQKKTQKISPNKHKIMNIQINLIMGKPNMKSQNTVYRFINAIYIVKRTKRKKKNAKKMQISYANQIGPFPIECNRELTK